LLHGRQKKSVFLDDPAKSGSLSKEEVDVLLATYRTIYLQDMHKHMLEQILSGDALETRKNVKRKKIQVGMVIFNLPLTQI
jgi:hypothetical protein